MSTIKAVRATITLGDIELDVFQLPDGTYYLSAKQVTEVIGIRHSRVAQISATNHAKHLAMQGVDFADFSPIKLISDVGKHSGYSLAQTMFVWQYEAFKGNFTAFNLVVACGVEALERRADSAFNVLRTEQERNLLLKQRLDSKLFRRSFTDAIKEYPLLTGDKPNYGRITIYVYQKLGLYSDYLAWKNNPDNTKIPFRDTIPPTVLQHILEIEDLAAKLILNRKIEICKSIKIAAQTLGYLEY